MVLIIADDPLARQVYAELFAMRGHRVETAASARCGLSRLSRRRDVGVVVLALAAIEALAPLRRRLSALSPKLRVHTVGLSPSFLDLPMPARQQLH